MRFTAAILFASAGIAVAQTTTTSASGTTSSDTGCQAENIVQACLASTGTRVTLCDPTDYSCLCSAYQDQLTCYNNCPGDQGRATVQSQVTANCVAASAMSSMSAATASTQSSSMTSSSGSSMSTTTASESPSSTGGSSGSAATPSSTGLAAVMTIPNTSMLAVALGLLGLM